MSGLLDNCRTPSCDCIELGEKRNLVASIVSGSLFFIGWWIVIDASALYNNGEYDHAFHTCGAIGTVAFFFINSVSNGQIRGDSYTDGCMGKTVARVWLFIGFLMGFGALIGASWILFGFYVVGGKQPDWPGIAIFLQNLLIFFSSLVFKFGRTEDLWG
ncbi:hypothetical protein ScPMuIL_012925 [Solemya velum]